MGYGGNNIPHPKGQLSLIEKTLTGEFRGNLTIENLQPSTSYFLYIVAGSTHPGMPDLMKN